MRKRAIMREVEKERVRETVRETETERQGYRGRNTTQRERE